MPKFSIQSTSKYSSQETYEKVKNYIQNEQGRIKTFDPTIHVELDDQKQSGIFKGKQLKAQFDVQDSGTTAQVVINVEIPFILSPLKGKITSVLQTQLEKYLS